MAAIQCPNYEVNLQICPCTEEVCGRRGICCQCVSYHRVSRQWPATACMRGSKRPVAILELPAPADLCANQPDNAENCLCESDSCARLGWCCECVRNHWTADGAGRTACMR